MTALAATVFSGFLLAPAAPLLTRMGGRWSGMLIALLPAALTLFLFFLIGETAGGSVITETITWVPSLDANLTFRVDGLSLLFGLMITGIGTLVVIYAGEYLKGHPELGKFYAYLLLFMASMLGVVFSGNLLALFVFWELTGISSYLLIGFDHRREASRNAALQALLITGGGGLAMMAGFLLLGTMGGSMEISELLGRGEALHSHGYYTAAAILILLGAFTKSAQFPFHFWLPGAMAAPTPVSAYLHSATMVKAGIYLIARLTPILGGTDFWNYTVGTVGAVTMVIGGVVALRQVDLKRILAYSTVSALGTLTMLLGLGSDTAVKAALVFLVVHSLYKSALFLSAGIIDHETGTRDIRHLGGLAGVLPITAVATLLAALSMAGLPPLLGFIGKELMYEATLGDTPATIIVTAATVAANACMVAVAGAVAVDPFFGRRPGFPGTPHTPSAGLRLGPALAAWLGLLLGMVPVLLGGTLIAPSASALAGRSIDVELALWHGITPMLLLSGLTLILGIGLFLLRQRLRSGVSETVTRRNGVYWYDRSLQGIQHVARRMVGAVQAGYLRRYLMTIVLFTVGLTTFTLARHTSLQGLLTWPDIALHEAVVVLLILSAALLVVTTGSRLTAVAGLGIIGFGVSMIYVMFGAPDLAMTQFAIETLTVILFVLVLYNLPRFVRYTKREARLRDMLIALTGGALMTVLTLAITDAPLDSEVASYYIEQSPLLAKGRNVVNVILVDFRSLDTLGEITVLAAAALGVFGLLKLHRSYVEKKETDG